MPQSGTTLYNLALMNLCCPIEEEIQQEMIVEIVIKAEMMIGYCGCLRM